MRMSKRTSKQTDLEVTSSAARETIRKNYAAIDHEVYFEIRKHECGT